MSPDGQVLIFRPSTFASARPDPGFEGGRAQGPSFLYQSSPNII